MDVWYASYGSNLLEARFMCYINGTQSPGSKMKEIGCTDKTPPKAIETIDLPYPLYFSKETSKWGEGGVAFIGHEKEEDEKTTGRMYLITEEQFKEVVSQENRVPDLDVDLEEVIRKGSHKIGDGWYGKVLYVGEKDGYPIFTFTSNDPIEDAKFTRPSSAYLSTIAGGLLDLGWEREDIVQYFLRKGDLAGHFNEQTLRTFLFPND